MADRNIEDWRRRAIQSQRRSYERRNVPRHSRTRVAVAVLYVVIAAAIIAATVWYVWFFKP